ncbi:LysR substrate-binding domain-containing protein [Marinomonas spartinae]|uniref:LysR substrate-binding domain-containing protein n=1 Tax=Marinomonas spartinae TaxID=1792290 RepID=UPI0018F163E2|nr:LysR substrate-binding domain-containing protein [Marinomonas spartinae]MBJ7552831.1 LysR family transcriptional regulator [Marinomonas spartinae]
MARLTYRQIEAFRAVMLNGTTSGAADMMCISQPAVSRLLSDFEAELGVTMFERHKKRLIATPEAHVFYAEVERSFISLERLARAADDLKECHLGFLRIASMPAVSIEFIPTVIHAFNTAHQGVSLSFQVRSTQQVVDLVASQQYDVGIVSAIPVADRAVGSEILAKARMICILPPNHQLANKAVISPEDLAGESFISLGIEQSIRSKIDNVFESANVYVKKTMDTQLVHSACAMVLQGDGVSIVEPIAALHYQKLGLLLKPFEPLIEYRYNLIYPAHKAKSSLVQSFVTLLRKELGILRENSNGILEFID